jgi:hypothetical protein
MYPKARIYEWTALEAVEEMIPESPASLQWQLKGNFYVVTDSVEANIKLGVSLAIVPPAEDFTWKDGSIFQSYI